MEIVVPLLIALTAYTPMTQLQSRHLFTITIKLHPTEELGQTPAGNRRVFAVSGGDFKGDRLRGSILPIVGSDLVRCENSAEAGSLDNRSIRRNCWRLERRNSAQPHSRRSGI
jgi:hypothetical protein